MKGESNLLNMIIDRIGQNEVLLPINQNCDEIWERSLTGQNALQQHAHTTLS